MGQPVETKLATARRPRLPIAIAGLLLLASCNASPFRSGLDSPDPAARLAAIQQAGQTRDRSAVRGLVDALDSDDAVVRMMAIHALEAITGERREYDPYDDSETRRKAANRWEQAVREGRLDHRGEASSQAVSASPMLDESTVE